MTKLLNRKTIQYIKQGQVLYGYNGLDIKKFDKYTYRESEIKKLVYELLALNLPERYKLQVFEEFLNKYFTPHPGRKYYSRKDSEVGKQLLLTQRLVPDKNYPEDYFRDSQTGLLYRMVKKSAIPDSMTPKEDFSKSQTIAASDPNYFYVRVDNDVTHNGKTLLKARENGNFGKYHTDLDVAYGNWQGKKVAVRYNKDNKTWTFNPVDDGINKWMDVKDPNFSKYLNSLYLKNFTTTPSTNTSGTNTEGNTTTNTEGNTNTGAATNTGGNASQAAPGTATEGPAASNFEALNVTDRRDIVPSVVSQPQVSQTSTRLLPKVKPVARPKDMPLMNRSDIRYTINDVTGSSPYFSSDVELVNSLAGTSNDNMFKQALMNRLGMDKWDNTTALNRLNFLGIKGHIGGSDRKRLRNLINKGTTIEGTIRKKQGGKLKLIKRYG